MGPGILRPSVRERKRDACYFSIRQRTPGSENCCYVGPSLGGHRLGLITVTGQGSYSVAGGRQLVSACRSGGNESQLACCRAAGSGALLL